jgi:ActR/RegA family two-component response regulator
MARKTRDTASAQPAALRPLVLLVDADALSRSRLARALVTEGFDVRLALADFDDAERPRLAIVHLDAQPAGGSGILAALLDRCPKVPVMLCAAHPEAAAIQARRLGLHVARALATTDSFGQVIARAKEMFFSVASTLRPPAAEDDGRSSFERIKPEATRRVPVLLVSRGDVGWFDGDPQERALLASVDGRSDLHALAIRCGLDEETALKVADALITRGLLTLREPS